MEPNILHAHQSRAFAAIERNETHSTINAWNCAVDHSRLYRDQYAGAAASWRDDESTFAPTGYDLEELRAILKRHYQRACFAVDRRITCTRDDVRAEMVAGRHLTAAQFDR